MSHSIPVTWLVISLSEVESFSRLSFLLFISSTSTDPINSQVLFVTFILIELKCVNHRTGYNLMGLICWIRNWNVILQVVGSYRCFGKLSEAWCNFISLSWKKLKSRAWRAAPYLKFSVGAKHIALAWLFRNHCFSLIWGIGMLFLSLLWRWAFLQD